MIPKIMHQTAPTKRLTWEERRIADRLRRMLPDWEYRLWDDADNRALISRAFPEYLDQYDSIPFGVAKADVARYAILAEQGGFYFDTDYKLLKPIGDEWLSHGAILPIEYVWPEKGPNYLDTLDLANCVIASQAGYPFFTDFVRHIFEVGEPEKMKHRSELIGVTGPVALTNFYIARPSEYPEIVLPEMNVFQPRISMMALRSTADDGSIGVHLHFGSWRNRDVVTAARTLLRRKLNGLLS